MALPIYRGIQCFGYVHSDYCLTFSTICDVLLVIVILAHLVSLYLILGLFHSLVGGVFVWVAVVGL